MTPIMENRMDMEHEMETRFNVGIYRAYLLEV